MAVNYSELVRLVIADYNSVWSNLTDKTGLIAAYKTEKNLATNAKIETAKYGELVGKLTFIDGATELGIHSANLYNRTTVSADAPAYSITTYGLQKDTDTTNYPNRYNVLSTIDATGLYTQGTQLASYITGTPVHLEKTNKTVEFVLNEDTNKYTVSYPTAVISSVTVDKGSVTLSGGIVSGDANGENGLANHLKLSYQSAAVTNAVTNVITVAENASVFKLKVSAKAYAVGSITAKTSATVTEGYVTETPADDVNTLVVGSKDAESAEYGYYNPDANVAADASGDLIVYIQEGSVKVTNKSEGETTSTTASITDNNAGILSQTGGDNFYTLKSSIQGLDSLKVEIQEGYITAASENASGTFDVEADDGYMYVKKGSANAQEIKISDSEFDADFSAFSVGGSSTYLADDTTAHKLTINVDTTTKGVKHNVEYGYLKETDVTAGGDITVKGSKDIYLKAATAKANYLINSYTPSGDTSILTNDSTDVYSITVTPVVDVKTDGTLAGWLSAGSEIDTAVHTNSINSYTLKIKESKTSNEVEVFNSVLHDVDDNGSGIGTLENIGSLFYSAETAVPAGRDYFEITAGFTHDVSAGYTAGGSHTHTVKRYMPKAVIEHVEGGVDGEDFYQVKYGGYLPSGVLSDISTVAPSMASVEAILSTSINNSSVSGVISTSQAEGAEYYTIDISKGSVDAGYISAAETKGTLSTTAYIKKGSATAAATIEKKDAELQVVEGESNYTMTANLNVASGISVVDGFIKTTDVTDTTTVEQSVSYTVDKAQFAIKKHQTSLATDHNVRTREEGDVGGTYTVSPKVTACTSTYDVTTPGYISGEIEIAATGEGTHDTEVTALSLHPGQGYIAETLTLSEGAESEAIGFTNNFDQKGLASYTITMNGKVGVTGTVDTGYYGDSESTVATGLLDLPTKTATVNRGHITAVATGTCTVATSNVADEQVTLVSDKVTGKSYVSLHTEGTHGVSITSITEGYIKEENGDITVTPTVYDSSNKANVVYIEKYSATKRESTEDVTNIDVHANAVVFGQSADFIITEESAAVAPTVRLATAEKYSKKDTNVQLSADAMGTNVMSDLLLLYSRMQGVEEE